MMKIKIFFLITGLFAGGAENMLKKIIMKLNHNKYEIILCSLLNLTDILGDLKNHVERIYVLDIKGTHNFLFEFVKLRKILKIEKPRIIHCFMIHANILGRIAAIGFNAKVISSVRTKLIMHKYLNLIDNLTQRFVDLYTVNSYVLKDFIVDYGIDKNKIIIIENGVDFNQFNPFHTPQSIKKRFNLSSSLIITMVAHFRKQKDYPTILKALYYLKKEFDFNFLAVGSGNKFVDETIILKKLIQALNLKNVKLLGLRKDIPELLALTDIWVSSTLYEGQSNSLLEAMAMKKPIITTNIPENAEIVGDGKEGLLVPVKEPKKFAAAIKTFITDKKLAATLAENAYKKVHTKYNIKNTIRKIEKLYEFLCQIE